MGRPILTVNNKKTHHRTQEVKMSFHTYLDRQAFKKAGFSKAEIADREPRSNPVSCPFHDHRHPVKTMNLGGYCDHPNHYKPPSLHKCEPGAGFLLKAVAT